MSDQMERIKEYKSSDKPPVMVQPTLFIGIGGTGMEIALRVRRRILNYVWGTPDKPVRLSKLSEFPLAQFIHFDLAQGARTETGKDATDPLVSIVKFGDDERIVFPLDTEKYFRTDGELNTHPHIASWFPLTRTKFLKLGIHPEDGAGQIRALSRLYFFDKYIDIRQKIEGMLDALIAGVSNTEKTKRLNLELESGSLRVVVIASVAGGTGSGAFLDMGYLTKMLASDKRPGAKIDLMLMLPTAYAAHNKARTEANAYAALMELETCMSQDLEYVKGWARNQDLQGRGRGKPYNDIFLFDTGNLALKKTAEATDVFDMVADILFEDFTSEDFANIKRSIAPNSAAQHKSGSYSPPVDTTKYGEMKLMYSLGYSAFGQAIIDTQLEQKRNEIACEQVNHMLKVFFGIASDSGNARKVPPPTPDEGRSMLREHAYCKRVNFELNYDFITNASPFKKGDQIEVRSLVDYLLYEDDKTIIGSLHSKIDRDIEEILATTEKDQRMSRVDRLCNQLDRDLGIEGGASDAGARGLENTIHKRRMNVFKELVNEDSNLLKALWDAVDNKEKGGIDYTIQLIERMKDEIENNKTGLLQDMANNQKRFTDICDRIHNGEIQVLRERYGQVKGKTIFGGNKEDYAKAIIQQIDEAIRWYVELRLRALACREAAELLKDMSSWLGQHLGLDEKTGRKQWAADSFAGKLASYEKLVVNIMSDINEEVIRSREATKQGHATYQVIKASTEALDAASRLAPNVAMEWATSVFESIGKSRVIFQQLEDNTTKAELLDRLRNLALANLPSLDSGKDNPLFKAFAALREREGEGALRKLCQNCIEMSIPWIEANLEGNWGSTLTDDQYSCIIGINDRDTFSRDYLDLFRVVPARTKMTASKIKPCATGIPGKLTCYVELSGIPLPALTALSGWRDSYYEESKKIPVHTHKDKTLFVHPMAPSVGMLDRLADDFKLFIQGIVSGALSAREDGPRDLVYCITLTGEELSIGNERNIRMEGISSEYQTDLKKKIRIVFDRVKTSVQLAGLVAIYDYYAKRVYPTATIRQEGKDDTREHGFCNILCAALRDEAWKTLQKKQAATDINIIKAMNFVVEKNIWIDERAVGRYESEDGREIINYLRTLDNWTDEVEYSETDVYQNEFGISEHKPKRILKPEFFQTGWFEQSISSGASIPFKAAVSPLHQVGQPSARLSSGESGAASDPAERLMKIKQLYDAGVLKQEEYEQKKSELIKLL